MELSPEPLELMYGHEGIHWTGNLGPPGIILDMGLPPWITGPWRCQSLVISSAFGSATFSYLLLSYILTSYVSFIFQLSTVKVILDVVFMAIPWLQGFNVFNV